MDNSLAIRKPKLSKQWHETKNGKLTPFDVTYSSDKKELWERAWMRNISNRHKGNGCPYCSRENKLRK